MTLTALDSRSISGTDIERSCYLDAPTISSGCIMVYPKRQTIRVILAQFGKIVQMSAPEIDIVVEGHSRDEVWARFLASARKRDDSAWLTFDVGPTRREEISLGLNAPDDEDWSGLISDGEE